MTNKDKFIKNNTYYVDIQIFKSIFLTLLYDFDRVTVFYCGF